MQKKVEHVLISFFGGGFKVRNRYPKLMKFIDIQFPWTLTVGVNY